MATQRLTMATLAGRSADAVAARFRAWRTLPDPDAVDRFCAALRDNGLSLPVVYFCEWVDHWLMGDLVPGPDKVDGRRFQATCLTPERAGEWADGCGYQFFEQVWLASRLREAATGWGPVTECRIVVVVRETFGPSTTDDEVRASLGRLPAWLAVPD